jgi:unsaturated chondroitin disaccharide hydrolase
MKSFAVALRSLFFVIAVAVHFSIPTAEAQSAGCTDQALTFAQSQITNTLAYASTSQFPSSTNPANANKWNLASSSLWTSGFFPGELWFMYEQTLGDTWLNRAQAQTAGMQSQDVNASDHDIGFKILGSYGNAFRITRDPADMAVIQTAANAMATNLWRPGAGVIESWPSYDSHITVIIDNMMNLELLLFAAQNGGDSAWRDMAVSHALKTMENHVRADGSTYHVVDYNTDGTVFSKFTVQGAGTETTWSRGQAWGIYGFTMVYRYIQDPRFLNTAQQLADYFINHLPADFVPYWDFSQSGTAPRDSSAAAIAAAGLLELSAYVAPADGARYRAAALNIQSSLSSPAYLGNTTAGDGIILHGTANAPGGDTNKSLIYGDYYFIQGCNRARSVPTAPTNVSASPAPNGQINLAWDAQSGLIRYSVKRSATFGGPYIAIAPPPILSTNSYSDTGLSPGSTYFYVVSAIDASGESPNSTEVSAAVDNPVPAISSLSPANAPAGTAFVLTVNGSSFLPTSTVNFGGQPQPTSSVSSTQLTASISATAVGTAGGVAVTVTNLAPGGGPSAANSFMLDDFAISVPSASVTLSSGKSVAIPVTVAPSDANGFANLITFGVSGLPSSVSASFNPRSVTPGANPTSTTLTLTSAPQSAIIPPSPQFPLPEWSTTPLFVWLAAGLSALVSLRLRQQFATLRLRSVFAVLLVGLATFCGCSGTKSSNTTMPPPVPQPTISQLTVTATSGTDAKTIQITLTSQ